MRVVRQATLLARSEFRQELRDLELTTTGSFFAFVLVILFALSFADLPARGQALWVAGMIWLGLAFVGALTLTRAFEREQRADTLRALLVAPVDRVALYLAKVTVIASLCTLSGCAIAAALMAVFPAAQAAFRSPAAVAMMIAVVALGSIGYAAIGTLFAAGIAGAAGRSVLLSVVFYPLSAPVLLVAVAATQRVLDNHPGALQTLVQLLALDLVLLAAGCACFDLVLVGRTPPAGVSLPDDDIDGTQPVGGGRAQMPDRRPERARPGQAQQAAGMRQLTAVGPEDAQPGPPPPAAEVDEAPAMGQPPVAHR